MTKDKGMASHPGFKFQLNPSFILSIHTPHIPVSVSPSMEGRC